MRIVKASVLAAVLSVSLGLGSAMAGDLGKSGHPWLHSGKHPICELLKAIFTLGHHHKNVVSVSG
jgi:hypothetical protein